MPNTTRPRYRGKKAAINRAYTGILAEQDMKGVSMMVIRRSRSFSSVRAAITPGTEQPKPMSMGTKERPDKPVRWSSLSIMKAARAIYRLSSRIERKKNSSRI